jgi:hypothetical protein
MSRFTGLALVAPDIIAQLGGMVPMAILGVRNKDPLPARLPSRIAIVALGAVSSVLVPTAEGCPDGSQALDL